MSEIDLVIPMFNGKVYIERVIDSLNSPTYAPSKVIVVDDGFADSSLELVKSYQSEMPSLILLRGAHKGVSTARNIDVKYS